LEAETHRLKYVPITKQWYETLNADHLCSLPLCTQVCGIKHANTIKVDGCSQVSTHAISGSSLASNLEQNHQYQQVDTLG